MTTAPDMESPAAPALNPPGDCAIVGVMTEGVPVLAEEPGVVLVVFEGKAGTGGSVDKLSLGAGVLKCTGVFSVCAA